MPKASTETTEAPKRAPRKRAVRRVVAAGDAPVRRTRAAAPRETVEVAPVRKAPARVVESPQKKSRTKIYAAIGAFVFVAGAAAWIGVSDAGQINVDARITEVNERAAQNQNEQQSEQGSETQTVEIPVQNTPPVVPLSSLRGRGVGTADVEQPAPEVPPESASTTEDGTEPSAEGEAVTEETSAETTPSEGESTETETAPQ